MQNLNSSGVNPRTIKSGKQCSSAQKMIRDLSELMQWTEDRLEALLLLQCHREHCPTPDDVLSAFAKKSRRLSFVL